ncbi:MAG: hypothetical protein N7Q72_02135, partial [Spiroplasma sp. Tabriz.8]|nr:hypothetical protein [Spiroplasma sp. Tabriz.8]
VKQAVICSTITTLLDAVVIRCSILKKKTSKHTYHIYIYIYIYIYKRCDYSIIFIQIIILFNHNYYDL